jgi:outer membrane protein TolC
MKKISRLLLLTICCLALEAGTSQTQPLTLKDALGKGLTNYGSIKAKTNYVNAAKAALQQSKRDYLPNVILSAQQDYGTINGQNGPIYGFTGLGVASAGPPLPTQNWNASFGALYLANVNWDFFSFGKTREKIKVAQGVVSQNENDLAQEQFQQQIQLAAAYLNLLALQRITHSQEKNLERTLVFKENAVRRAKNQLIAGVDTSLAAAEVSAARIALTNAKDNEQDQDNKLAVLMGVDYAEFALDTSFIGRIPKVIGGPFNSKQPIHPILGYYQSRINLSNEQLSYDRRLYYPTFSFFGVFQEKASGFNYNYSQNQPSYSGDYATGVNPSRDNYLLGVGLNWNLTTLARNASQVKYQEFVSEGLKNEYDQAALQIKAQLALSDSKIKNALANYTEAPVQVDAATVAFLQKTTLYKNGLATLVDVTQAMYALNRAETDRDIAFANVWQALLLKAAAVGELSLFTNEF